MNAAAFRHYYDYHFAENRKIWENYISRLSDDEFTLDLDYSHGSVRDQILHLIDVDDAWFGDLRGEAISDGLNADDADRETIRAHWDMIEQAMRDYLADLQDDMLFTKPLSGEDENLILWQILLHVVNHGTDHRAQLLRQLNDLGVDTQYQDYVFYVYGHPMDES